MQAVTTLQEALIDEILNRFSKKSEAANKLMEVLSINRDGVYRRLRGDTVTECPGNSNPGYLF